MRNVNEIICSVNLQAYHIAEEIVTYMYLV